MSTADAFEVSGSASAGSVHNTYVIRVGGQPLAIGLFWNDIQSRPNAAKEARAMAARPQIEADLYCIRSAGGQFGLGRKVDGHAKSMVPLAGALADKHRGSWIGMFAVGGGFYLIGVRDDDIIEDRFVEDELEARGKFEELIAHSGWSKIYASDAFQIDDAEDVSIEELLDKAKSPRLQETDRVGGLLKLVVGGGVVVALLFGGMYYMQWKADQDLLAEQERQRQAYEETLPAQGEVVRPPMPWEGRQQAANYVSACMTALNRAVIAVPGWKMTELACEGQAARMRFLRDGALNEGGGPITWIRLAMDRGGLTDSSAFPVEDNAVDVTWPIQEGETYTPDLNGGSPSLRVARRFLQTRFEDTFTPITFPSEAPSEFWATLNFSFETPFDPREFESILKEVPGLTIDRVFLDVPTLTYRVEGSVYEELEIVNAQLN